MEEDYGVGIDSDDVYEFLSGDYLVEVRLGLRMDIISFLKSGYKIIVTNDHVSIVVEG